MEAHDEGYIKSSELDKSILSQDIFTALDIILTKQPRSTEVRKDEIKCISENDNVILWTWGIYNCKGIILVYKNSDTNEIFYSLEHCDPNEIPQMRIPEGHQLLEKYWIDGPRPDERIEWMNEDAKNHFKSTNTTGGSISTIIKQEAEDKSVRAVGISINPEDRKIYILNFYAE